MVQRARGSAVLPGFDLPLLFIAHLEELQKIYQDEEGIHIGAAAILTDMMEHELIPDILKEMIGQMASPPTRNMATIAGNICNASPAGDTLPYLYAVNAKVRLQRAEYENSAYPGLYYWRKENLLAKRRTAYRHYYSG